MAALRKQYGCGPVELTGSADGLYERHLLFDSVIDPAEADARDRYEALARSVRDVLSQRWVRTEQTYERLDPKRVYYLSMEFLIGRSLTNNITNLLLSPLVDDAVKRKSFDGSACSRRNPMPHWATEGSGVWPPASSTRWPRWRFRPSGTGCDTSTECSGSPSETDGNKSSPTTGFGAPTRGRSFARTTRSKSG
jgi:hypothetical protein